MAYPRTAHQSEVSEGVRQLRSTLGLTQQSFAAKLNTALTTIARWETIRSPRGSTLNVLARLAEESERPDLAAIFRKEVLAELGLALRSQFHYAVRHQRQAASGEEALRSMINGLRRLSGIFNQPNVTLDDAIRSGKDIDKRLAEFEALIAALDPANVGSSPKSISSQIESEK